MKLDRLHEYLMTTVVLIAGLGFAVYCGKMTGEGQSHVIALAFFSLLIGVLCLRYRTGMWLAIPLTWHLTGQVAVLPLPVAARDLVILSVFGMFIAFVALKFIRIRPSTDALDIWLIITLLYVASTFVRNPIGSWSMGSQRVGGRHYFTVFTAVLACWVLSRVSCKPKTARWLPAGMATAVCGESIIMLLCQRYWGLAAILGQFYSGFAVDTKLTAAEMTGYQEHDTRQIALSGPGRTLFEVLIAYFRPLSLVNPLHLFRFLGLVLSLGLIFYSGFRSILMVVILGFLLSSYFRRGWPDVVRISAFFLPVLILTGLLQGTIVNLPMPVQRTLSFLPGNWDALAKEDAASSTQWRMEMWKDALTTDKYIDDKWFGDGFGTSYARMQQVMMIQSLPGVTTREGQESAAIVGDFHSGPVSAVRCVGFAGLLLFIPLLFQTLRAAIRTVRRAMGTPYQALALFLCIPMVIRPFYFLFIFGAYTDDLAETIVAVGMLKMLGNSLDQWESTPTPPAALAKKARPVRSPVRIFQPVEVS